MQKLQFNQKKVTYGNLPECHAHFYILSKYSQMSSRSLSMDQFRKPSTFFLSSF